MKGDPTRCRHEAVFYRGLDGFIDAAVPFIREGVAAGEPVLVVVAVEKIDALRADIAWAEGVAYSDMHCFGVNPGRIIALWLDFVAAHAASGLPLRGIGELVWPQRSPAELTECHRQEELLNVAFHEDPPLHLMCPYDVTALYTDTLDTARATHPFVVDGAVARRSAAYKGERAILAPFDTPLPGPPASATATRFDNGSIAAARSVVLREAAAAGLDADRAEDAEVAANEVLTNSVRYARAGVLTAWRDADRFVCEVGDGGFIDDPLAGHERPPPDSTGKRGLWLVNQLADLVQLRSSPEGTTVRLHFRPASVTTQIDSDYPMLRP